IFGSAGVGLANLMIPIGMIVEAGGEIKDIVENSLKTRKTQVPDLIINIHSEVSDELKARIVRDIEHDIEMSTFSDAQKQDWITDEMLEETEAMRQYRLEERNFMNFYKIVARSRSVHLQDNNNFPDEAKAKAKAHIELLKEVLNYWKDIMGLLKSRLGVSLNIISENLDFSTKYLTERTSQLKNKGLQTKKVYDRIFIKLYENYYEVLSEMGSWDLVKDKFLIFYSRAFPAKPSLPILNPESQIRVALLEYLSNVIGNELISISGKDKILVRQNQLSRIIFNGPNYIRLNYRRSIGKRLKITTLYKMLYNVRNLRYSDLEGIIDSNNIKIQSHREGELLSIIRGKLSKKITPYT
ncbi:hypothetical protein LCGC14_2792560, partial [marine sediment metagenome]